MVLRHIRQNLLATVIASVVIIYILKLGSNLDEDAIMITRQNENLSELKQTLYLLSQQVDKLEAIVSDQVSKEDVVTTGQKFQALNMQINALKHVEEDVVRSGQTIENLNVQVDTLKQEISELKNTHSIVPRAVDSPKTQISLEIEEAHGPFPWDTAYTNYNWNSNVAFWQPPLPNKNLIFHNKLPKAGSTTMNYILFYLSQKNSFKYQKIQPGDLPNDSYSVEEPLVNWIKENVTESPFLLLKHHYPIDFTKYGLDQPTYMNVMRDPVDWFQSHYYFERFGWQKVGGSRDSFKGSDEDRDMIIDDCVTQKASQCVDVPWSWIDFFCGNGPDCNKINNRDTIVATTKTRIQRVYYMIGILEQWDNTLSLFERMMPDIFQNVKQIFQSPGVQTRLNSTKSVNNVKMNAESREYFQKGPLKEEYDIYVFTRALFNERLRKFGITPIQKK